MRFAIQPNDRLVRELVGMLYREDDSYAATWRAVGSALENGGFRRPSYELVRRLAGLERLRRERRAAVRQAQRDVAAAFLLSWRAVDTPIALERLRDAQRDERLVTQWHEPPRDGGRGG
ncbi:MAG TPA: hypothetical protein VML35_08145 [Gaiellaceae bacterium]|nr:hypothetical protein [Gaiellaceae bacterium]